MKRSASGFSSSAAASEAAAGASGCATTVDASAPGARSTARLVGLGVAGGFLLLALAWSALFVAAGRVQTQFIPVQRSRTPR